MKSKSRTFYRYILSYALVLILPVAVLFTLFSSFIFDLYRQEIQVSFLKKLRDERKFASLNELKKQILQDELLARDFFSQSEEKTLAG